ncbi:dihydrodipicolinate synthase family protein [Kosakonia sp. SMBL-WEM22]|uniref:dihydrodipicolinate synthase family protein n=1 Tax=Kosakonia sp. SMBL-WEM22 TaxID=2725560 RepID=UPI001659131D|nr:dihydrodipicolinate synthase family protein [Kosakonia sp. SMBL-WEM22]QNQ18343.1 dihydrodipicolinate synthase family protein [Kosakonia sp. SMBL-WEM22]
MDFTGLSAFALTPLLDDRLDEATYITIIEKLRAAGVDSIGALGSTGCYPYFSRSERASVLRLATEYSGAVPVIAGIGALRQRDVLWLAEDAQKAGVSAVLLAPVSYHPLTEDEVFDLFATVTRELSVPLCIYNNPSATHFTFSDELLARIAQLPNIGSIKIPPLAAELAPERINALRAHIPAEIRLGISGDATAVEALNAGCSVWYSVFGGLFPQAALAISRAAMAGDVAQARQHTAALQPLWDLFKRYGGSLRVIATAAELLGVVKAPCLPAPLQTLQGDARREIAQVIEQLRLTA